jgi:hypothetical protein
MHYEKLHLPKLHNLTTKIQKKLIYNYYVIIPWVLQLLCNYPFRNTAHK